MDTNLIISCDKLLPRLVSFWTRLFGALVLWELQQSEHPGSIHAQLALPRVVTGCATPASWLGALPSVSKADTDRLALVMLHSLQSGSQQTHVAIANRDMQINAWTP